MSAATQPTVLARDIRGERVLLHPLRAVLWPARSTVIVADIHFGKSGVFGRHGLAVPDGSDALDRQRLQTLLHESGAQRLLVLGDFLHGPLPAHSPGAVELDAWLASLRGIRVEVVTGNHDRSAARGWQPPVQWHTRDLLEGPFRFTHEDGAPGRAHHAFTFSGHVHPVIGLTGLRKQRLRVPVFWERRDGMVLPSFGLFTGGWRLHPSVDERVYAAGPDSVIELKLSPRRTPSPGAPRIP